MGLKLTKGRRWASAAILAGTLVVAATGTAMAASSGKIKPMAADGVAFADGTYQFDPWPCTSACDQGKFSGFNYYGTLHDMKADKHDVFVHAKVDGYGYAARIYLKGGPGHSSVSQRVLDVNGDPSTRAMVEVCTDKGTFGPDSCDRRGWFRRH